MEHCTDSIAVKVKNKSKKKYYGYVKRLVDVTTALLLLPIFVPVFLLVGIIIKIDSKGPILFIQDRSGLNNIPFKIYKFRTMCTDKDLHKKFTGWTVENDPRITKVGKVLRKYRIDELPQLLNLLIGNMSLVGPRPETVRLTEEFSKDIPNFKRRLSVKPGITGLAQINGGYEHSPSEKLSYDLEYIDKMSVGLDVLILFRTIIVVVSGHGSR